MRTVIEALKYAHRKCKSSNPIELAKALNIIILYVPLINIRGFYKYYKRNHIIFIADTLPPQELPFVLAHEIGHMLMHKDKNALYLEANTYFDVSKYERQANTFAVNWLLPDALLQEYPDYSIYDLGRSVGIPAKLVELKQA